MRLPVAILAGGLATRLRPITDRIPKALVPVAGRPFIDHQLALLRDNGFVHVILCVGYLGEMIQAHVGDGSSMGMRVAYQFDGPELLGTGGALRRALPLLGDAFLVLYGDSYLPCDYRAIEQAFRNAGQPALMTVLRNENRWDASNVIFEDGRVRLYSKVTRTVEMRYIDYGVGVLSVAAFADVGDKAPLDLAEIYSRLADEGRLAGFEVHERFYEIGSIQGLADTERYLAENPPTSIVRGACPTPSSI